jgi:hypothetical protein
MGSEFVSLGVTEFPDFLLDEPLNFFTEGINLSLPSETSLMDGSEDTFFSGEEISSLGVSKSVHAGISGEVGSEELGLEVSSDGLDAGLNVSLNVTDVGNESGALFWDSFHGPGAGTLNEPSFIVDVLDVNWVLSVSKGCHVVLNCNTLLESGISSTGTFSPGASVSDLGDITGLSVSKAVGDLDPLPSFTRSSDVVSDNLVFSGFPGSVSDHLLSHPLSKEGRLGYLGEVAGGEGRLGVGIKGSLLANEGSLPGGKHGSEVSLEDSVKSSALSISGFSGGGEGLIESVLGVVVPD